MQRNRLNVYMSPETMREIEMFADQLHMTKTGVGSLAIQLGMHLLKLSKNQEFADMVMKEPEIMDKLERMAKDAEKIK